MRKSRFSEKQITMALRQAESGTPVPEICRKLQVAEGGRPGFGAKELGKIVYFVVRPGERNRSRGGAGNAAAS